LGSNIIKQSKFVEVIALNQKAVPFRLADEKKKPLIFIEVWVNNQGPFSFVVDTGATITVLSPETAQKVGLDLSSGAKDTGHGAGGQVQVSLVSLESLRIGETEIKDLKAAIMDLTNLKQVLGYLDGVIGYNFLSKFRVIIDYPKRVISFEPSTP
jgi:clan AA aspartic protease (TIGR02281 family)